MKLMNKVFLLFFFLLVLFIVGCLGHLFGQVNNLSEPNQCIPVSFKVETPISKRTKLKDSYVMNEEIDIILNIQKSEYCTLVNDTVYLYVNEKNYTINLSNVNKKSVKFPLDTKISNTHEFRDIFLKGHSQEFSLGNEIIYEFETEHYTIQIISSSEQLALSYAGESLRIAEEANKLSKDSNKIAMEANKKADIANKFSSDANDTANSANRWAIFSAIVAFFVLLFDGFKYFREKHSERR
ncbi:hypothetical protein KY366_03465 [Candidatus Woesearchaeota archaeon]|nr:hypothetical protein [Candidatus Woesearchaeota archaeon]